MSFRMHLQARRRARRRRDAIRRNFRIYRLSACCRPAPPVSIEIGGAVYEHQSINQRAPLRVEAIISARRPRPEAKWLLVGHCVPAQTIYGASERSVTVFGFPVQATLRRAPTANQCLASSTSYGASAQSRRLTDFRCSLRRAPTITMMCL